MDVDSLLLTPRDVRDALGPSTDVENPSGGLPQGGVGEVLRAAAAGSAYRRFTGRLATDDGAVPFAVGDLVLTFDSPAIAARTFDQVAGAAHLRTEVDGAGVAVETVAAPSGLVSYWGFVHRGRILVVLTLDSVNPQTLSIAALRALVLRAAHLLGDVPGNGGT